MDAAAVAEPPDDDEVASSFAFAFETIRSHFFFSTANSASCCSSWVRNSRHLDSFAAMKRSKSACLFSVNVCAASCFGCSALDPGGPTPSKSIDELGVVEVVAEDWPSDSPEVPAWKELGRGLRGSSNKGAVRNGDAYKDDDDAPGVSDDTVLYDIEDSRFGIGRFVCPVGVLFVEFDRLRPFDVGLAGGGNLGDVAEEGEDNTDA